VVEDTRILIVDDNPLNLKLTRLVLKQAGFAVETAFDAVSALDVLRVFEPALILMDLQMPGMDGFELTRRLKTDPATRHIIIVALTAYAMKGDAQRAFAAGCDGYIAKPVKTRSLADQVKSYLTPS
jgi:two-component system, cell cycle response regulator DivK